MNILALQLKRIGDAILTAPALAGVRAANPGCRLTLVLAGAAGDLAPAFSAVDDVIVYHKRRPHRNMGIWAQSATGVFDLCLDYTGTDRSAVIAAASQADHRIGYAKFVADTWREAVFTDISDASVRALHTVDFHRALGGFPAAADQGFDPPDPQKSARPDGRFAIVHPGTARTEKYWFADRWARVMECLSDDHGLEVVLTGTTEPEERNHLAAIKGACRAPVSDLTGKLPLLGLASLVKEAALVLSVDSAAAHLAALAETPQITLFGPTNPFHWRARHPRATVLVPGSEQPARDFTPKAKGAPMRGISTAAVIRAIGNALP